MSKSNLLVENYNLLSTDVQRQQTLDQIFVLANYSVVIPSTLLRDAVKNVLADFFR